MYGSWGHAYRQLKRWSEDVYNSYGRYLPSAGVGYSSGLGFGHGINNLVRYGGEQFNRAWNESHGGNRFWMSQIPGWGWGKMLEGMANWFEDYYKHTGYDPKYPQVYGGGAGGLVGQMSSQVGQFSPKRWAKDLESMFAPQFEENLTREQAFSKGYW